MAIIHRATITPSKLETIDAWLRAQPWFIGDADAPLVQRAAYRFDDPDGEVGIETLLVSAGDGPLLQVPVTYRGVPDPDARSWLIGTMTHSVLGERWVYDAAGDPVAVRAFAAAVLGGGTQADLMVQEDGGPVRREPTATARGTGTDDEAVDVPTQISVISDDAATVVTTPGFTLTIVRRPGAAAAGDGPALLGSWGDTADAVLATATA